MIVNIWTNMSPTAKRHMKAICSGAVEKTTVIGLRKILNAQWRKDRGYSVSVTAPAVTAKEVQDLERALERNQPKVTGSLHDSGVKLLQDRRYRKRFSEAQLAVIADIDYFRLIGFTEAGNMAGKFYPIYRCFGRNGDKFAFYNVPWQSGGNGPQTD